MNKLFIGLLIIAAGAGAFFLLRKKKDTASHPVITKEDIIGKWKSGPVSTGNDSNVIAYHYDFLEDGTILRSVNDSAKADTTHYSLNKNNDLVWKERKTDSTGNVFSVSLLSKDTLQLQANDSSKMLLIRL